MKEKEEREEKEEKKENSLIKHSYCLTKSSQKVAYVRRRIRYILQQTWKKSVKSKEKWENPF